MNWSLLTKPFRERTTTWAIAAILAFLLIVAMAKATSIGDLGITLLSGLFQGMLLFLVASGLSIIFGLIDVLNLAQGSFFMIGAYVAYEVQHPGGVIDVSAVIPDPNLRFPLAVIAAIGVGALSGTALERGLLRPLYARPIFQLVMTFGVSLVIAEIVKLIWSTTPYSWTDLFGVRESAFEVFGQRFSTYRLFVVGMGAVLIISIGLLLRYTRIGIIIRAGVEDGQMVQALGINVRAVFTLVFTLGCAVAAFGGAVAAPFLGASPSLAGSFLLQAIAVVVLGGMGSYGGTAVGSILVGLSIAVAQSAAVGTNFSALPSVTPMLLLVLVLLLRPSGLFGSVR
ncbi:MAG TPA: branched-chain amino acid ABC transporter permease [Aggregatilineales bacterium]|nr:branched-chain amino acid ABC transporter permease [Anaerolineales bacterium]HRE48730.1 branched-chain amino acid ABC transporter permease [Aggregatilineales bacterium]